VTAPAPAKAALLRSLLDDLRQESADLDGRVAPLGESGWKKATPAVGWSVRDTINHLAQTDEAALLAITDPDSFSSRLASFTATSVDEAVVERRTLSAAQALDDWRAGREALAVALQAMDGGVRVPWFGPPMSPASFVTARLMETWAHGQDVVDALGQHRAPTARLRSVAEIGVRARPFSYLAHGRELPPAPVHVTLTAPDGSTWSWGPHDADDAVRGAALDFCLLVTQRRHRDDLALQTTGEAAADWLTIAQSFAGPPGSGREPLG